MSSGSSKKKNLQGQETSKGSTKNEPSRAQTKPGQLETNPITSKTTDVQEQEKTTSAQKNEQHDELKNKITEHPDEEKTNQPVTLEAKPVNAKYRPKQIDKWQDADLSELMGGLELSDDPRVWEKYVDALVSNNKPEINPETQV